MNNPSWSKGMLDAAEIAARQAADDALAADATVGKKHRHLAKSLTMRFAINLLRENIRLRKIASYVPPMIYLKAKEEAGYGNAIRLKPKTK